MTTRIKIVTGHDGDIPWRDLLEANLREYCARWGYGLVMKFGNWPQLPRGRHVWWRKQELMRREFHSCDWMLWLDADCFVMNMATPLTQYIDDSFDVGVTGPFESTCANTKCQGQCLPVYSAGILLIRNCPWSRDLLENWWKSDDEGWRPVGCQWPGDSAYLSCKVMQDPCEQDHFKVFPLKEIGWANIAEDPSQFIAHCYGSTGEHRRERFGQYERHVVR